MNQILCIALALFVGLLSSRLMKLIRLPNVTGYLLSGILFGPFVLGKYIGGWSIDNPETSINAIKWISEIALGFIAFTIGCSFRKEAIQHVGKRVVIITLFEALGGSILVIGGLFVAHIFLKDQLPISLILTFGAIASATAPAATLMVIRQYKAKGPVVDTLIPVVAFDDAVALIAFAILFSIAKTLSGNASLSVMDILVWPLVEIFGSLALGALLGLGISLGFRFFKSRANRSILIICAIFIVVGLSMLAKTYGWKVSISSLLACMMIGAIFVNFREDASRTIERIDGITPPLYMLFFVISGASLDITIFASKGALTLVIIALVYVIFRCVGKWLGAFFGSKTTHADPTVQKYLGFTLFPQAGVAIGLATTANQTFPDATQASLVLAVILTSTIIYELAGPVITKIALKKAGEITEES
ncbi:MAG: cation:proton antiporter [Bacilli bacterium]|nr:cation:proton antiporter [Bacilli bacterium]